MGNPGSATDWDRTIVCQFPIGNSQSAKGTVIAARSLYMIAARQS